MKTLCQVLVLAWLVIAFFCVLKSSFEDRQAEPAAGFSGAVTTVLTFAFIGLVLWRAGAFSTFL